MELVLKNISFGYPHKELGHINKLQLSAGRIHYLMGANGAGKSTLFKSLAGQLKLLSKATLTLDGRDLLRVSLKQRARLIAYLHRSVISSRLTVREFLTIGVLHDSENRQQRVQFERTFKDNCASYGLNGLLDAYIGRISDGELQRVLITLFVLRDCPVILLDEPLSHLDPPSQMEMMILFNKISVDHIVWMSSHNLEQVRSNKGRVFALTHDEGFQEVENQSIRSENGLIRIFGDKVNKSGD